MGLYYTCDECGKTSKDFWPCSCPAKEATRLMELRIGSTVLDAFQYQSFNGMSLWEKLRRATGEIFCTITWVDNAKGLGEWWLVQTPEADFDTIKRQIAPEEDDDDSEEQRYKITGQAIQDGFRFRIFEAEFGNDLYALEVDKQTMETLRGVVKKQGFQLMPQSGVIIEEWFQPGQFWLKTVDSDVASQFEQLNDGDYLKNAYDLFEVYSAKVLESITSQFRELGWTEFRNENTLRLDRPNNELNEPTKKSKNAIKKQKRRQRRQLEKRRHENEQTRGRMTISHCEVLVPPVSQCQARVKSSGQVCTRVTRDEDQFCRVHATK
jgi:hypothetical protein